MPITRWTSLDTQHILPGSVRELPPVIRGMVSAVDTALGAVAEVTNALDGITSLVDSPQVIAVRAAVAQINAAIAAAAGQPGSVSLHYLNVPILRTDANILMPAVPARVTIEGPKSIMGSGGNVGFYNTVQRSLYDTLDPNRPLFPPTSYVSGAVLLAGAESFNGLVDMLQFLSRLGGAMTTGLDANVLPYPQNLVARPVPHADSTGLGMAVQLSWAPVLPVGKTEFGIAGFNIRNVIVYRSPEPISRATSVARLKACELTRFPFDPLSPRFIDNTVEPDGVYYYALGYEVDVLSIKGTSVPLKHSTVGSYVRVDMSAPLNSLGTTPSMFAHTARGTPPDWQMMSQVFDLIPALSQFMEALSNYVALVENTLAGTNHALRVFANDLRAIIAARMAIINRIIRLLDDVLDILVPTVGVYSFAFSGLGGNDFLLNALYTALFDTSDPNRPPFDTGGELVAGIVVVAGAGSLSALAPMDMLAAALTTGANTRTTTSTMIP